MKIWLDDIRNAPNGYIEVHSVNQAIAKIKDNFDDIDHDLGDFAIDGGDAIKLLDWCVENNFFPKVQLHTANSVGRANMMRLLNRHWKD